MAIKLNGGPFDGREVEGRVAHRLLRVVSDGAGGLKTLGEPRKIGENETTALYYRGDWSGFWDGERWQLNAHYHYVLLQPAEETFSDLDAWVTFEIAWRRTHL